MIELLRLASPVRRDRVIVLGGLAAVTIAAWAYLLYLAHAMATPGGMMSMMEMAPAVALPWQRAHGYVEIVSLFFMWAVMMVAMMTPTIAPLVLLFAGAHRQRAAAGVAGSAAVLLGGYLLVWTGFSALATLATWQLQHAALLSPALASTSTLIGGAFLVAAGVFQFTPLKRACLVRCRSPLGFLMSEWRDGRWGTFVMGFRHGVYCVGCCWLVMALLFVAGVMNLLWVAVLAAFVLVEKVAPRGERVGRIAGIVSIIAGGALMVAGR